MSYVPLCHPHTVDLILGSYRICCLSPLSLFGSADKQTLVCDEMVMQQSEYVN
jgi:hypothetical protein